MRSAVLGWPAGSGSAQKAPVSPGARLRGIQGREEAGTVGACREGDQFPDFMPGKGIDP
jgi:hypothetical protein